MVLIYFVKGEHFCLSHINFVGLSYNTMKHPASQAEQKIGALAADEPQDWFETKRKKTALNLDAVFFMLISATSLFQDFGECK
jgi:hypothetical protein